MNYIHYFFEIFFLITTLFTLYKIIKTHELSPITFVSSLCILFCFIISVITPFDSQPHHLMVYFLLLTPTFLIVLITMFIYITTRRFNSILKGKQYNV